ncbi:MAG: PAS domain S-box protein [bacterium]|nr:PAS domain S-box protein [bacterium]
MSAPISEKAVLVQLESVLATVTDAIISLDASQRIVLFNSAAEALLGCSAADALGSPVVRFVPSRFRKGYAGRLQRFSEGGTTSRVAAGESAVALRSNGEEVHLVGSVGRCEIEGETHLTVVLRVAEAAQSATADERLDVARRSALIEQAPVGIFELDLMRCFRFVNPFGLQTFGAAHLAQVIGKPYLTYVDAPDRERVEGFLERAVRGENVSFQFQGNGRFFSCSLSPLRGADGEIVVVLGVCDDVTARESAEKQLRESEQRLRAMANLRAGFIGFVTLDGTLLDANERSFSAIGARRSAVLGLPYWDTPWFAHDRELRGRVRDGVSRAAAGEFVRFDVTYPGIGDGATIIDFSLAPLRAKDGSVELLFAEGVDMTEQRSVEQELRDALVRTRAILDNTVECILTIDEGGIVRSVNRATPLTFGYSTEELVGASVGMLVDSSNPVKHDWQIEQYRRTSDTSIITSSQEVLGKRKDGTTFHMTVAVSEMQLDGERFFVGTCRDLSRRRGAEERARRAAELAEVGTLTAGIAHDVGTPMNIILGYAGMLEQTASTDQERERLQIIQEQVRRVSHLIQSLLGFARPGETARVPVNVEEAIEAALDFLRERLRNHKITVERSYEPTPRIRGDREKLQQVFLNLFVNAADAMSQDGRLTVTLRPLGTNQIAATVADTGTGIEPDALEHIFEPFYTTKDRGRGTGLGLPVSRTIVDDHGGDLRVSSEVGKGTEFRIVLPIMSEIGDA